MRRREVIAFLGGGVVGWSLAAHAQQKAIPVIGNQPEDRQGARPRCAAIDLTRADEVIE
jgi:hypothetical protein